LILRQPERGYRYSLDPFLLADFCRPRPKERILDLGAGVVKGGRPGLSVLPRLVLHDHGGRYTAEVASLLRDQRLEKPVRDKKRQPGK